METVTREPEEHKGEDETASAESISISIGDPLADLSTIPQLETTTRIDTVGTVGGLRIYIPARVARDSQFPFRPGEEATIRVLSDGQGLLIIKKQ